MRTRRGGQVAAALRRMIPAIPDRDLDAVVERAVESKGLRKASPEAAAWLSAVAYIRHTYSEYDDLLADGYGPEAARHFSLPQINDVLTAWGCRKQVAAED